MKMSMFLILLLSSIFLNSCSKSSDTVTPPPTITIPNIIICNQAWMTKNLDVATYRNGDIIRQVTDSTQWANLTTGAWCYYNNDPSNEGVYGKLYNGFAVHDPRGLAPLGWHIPTDEEWSTLSNCLGGDSIAGGKMKTTSLWNAPDLVAPPYNGGTNSSQFAGLPGGIRTGIIAKGVFYGLGVSGWFWSSSKPTNGTDNGVPRWIYFNNDHLYRLEIQDISYGYSIRCVKD